MADRPDYLAAVRGDRVVFDSNNSARELTLHSVGIIAACYCASLAADGYTCRDPVWAPMGVFALDGPKPGQYFKVPTYRITRLEYEGVGLRSTDRVLMVEENQNCQDAPLEICPLESWDELTGEEYDVRICGRRDINRFASYETQTLSSRTVGCDDLNANCLPPVLLKEATAESN
eukprot:CAMPEP_0198590422 /NCGR_PEP_ID=MMETSP1462-20131121/135641_1 /TAXON_ID=1333877 /ORGANISM="Brandtodinium nutriculum, Strain RCC3387" /LENGTH=174 /DNA_ID=CAMNT_0044321955 /DNA_START=33 /DNA_END=554 /DNA_ORIENTATION=+